MRMDCDQDAVWIKVEQTGAACHTNRRSCFYRVVKDGGRCWSAEKVRSETDGRQLAHGIHGCVGFRHQARLSERF